MVDIANGLVERGFKEGLDSGKGSNGIQFTVGGMRAAQGLSLGAGYRRSDLLREQLDYRGTARFSGHGGYMFDSDVEFSGLRTERTSLRWYTKYEHSPSIDYFGLGNASSKDTRASYRFDDLSSDFLASVQPFQDVYFGATGGYYRAHTAPSGEGGLPPIDEAFPPQALPGFDQDTQYHAHRRIRVLRLA